MSSMWRRLFTLRDGSTTEELLAVRDPTASRSRKKPAAQCWWRHSAGIKLAKPTVAPSRDPIVNGIAHGSGNDAEPRHHPPPPANMIQQTQDRFGTKIQQFLRGSSLSHEDHTPQFHRQVISSLRGLSLQRRKLQGLVLVPHQKELNRLMAKPTDAIVEDDSAFLTRREHKTVTVFSTSHQVEPSFSFRHVTR